MGDETETRRGSIASFIAELNAVQNQLDNTPLLERCKCRFLGGYFDENDNFHQFKISDPDYIPPKVNLAGWSIIEHFIDRFTCPQESLSNKNKFDVHKDGLTETLALTKDLFLNKNKYEIKLENMEFIILTCGGLALSGQKRALGGQTAKAINKVIKQVEQVIKEDKDHKRKLWG